MRNLAKQTCLTVLLFVLAGTSAWCADKREFNSEPTTNDGARWRIGYYEGGEYIDYQRTLMETARGLMKLGWIEPAEFPPQQGEQTHELWQWLATEAKSDYIEFVGDAYYSANWDDELRKTTAAKLLSRLNEQKDVDLLIAMGTWAGTDFANDKHQTPTMVLSTSDPLASGIIASVEDSGFDHLHARIDPNRYERQVQVFHEIIGFKKLGVAYEDSVDGRVQAAIDKVEKVAAQRGFELVSCFTKSDIADVAQRVQSVKTCFGELGKSVDAIYVTEQGGVGLDSIPQLVEIANKDRIPTFSQWGSVGVKYGFLISISQAGMKYVGEFHARTFAKVFNGAKPNELDQLFEEPPKIAINLKTAEIIGFDPPVVILGAADDIYSEIERP